jgi:hypothetical protein
MCLEIREWFSKDQRIVYGVQVKGCCLFISQLRDSDRRSLRRKRVPNSEASSLAFACDTVNACPESTIRSISLAALPS